VYLGIDHPAIACRDVDAMASWYCTHLAMKVIAKSGSTPPAYLVGYGKNASDGAMFELMPVRDEGPAAESFGRWAPGLRHVALRVENFDAAFAKLKAIGVPFIGEPVAAVGGGKIVSFRDPEGNELQIVQR
jgi:glyoxylase I family protein